MAHTASEFSSKARGNLGDAASEAAGDARRVGKDAASEFESLVADADDLLRNTVDTMGTQTAAARARLQKSIAQTRERLSAGLHSVTEQGRQAASAADGFVRESPWQAVGVAALAGLAVGFLIARK